MPRGATHVCQVIAPALARGEVVISDRFSDATFAYQGAGRGLDWDVLLQLERLTLAGFGLNPDLVLKPDLTLWFDLPAAVAAQRLASARLPDRFEAQPAPFFAAVAGAMPAAARKMRRALPALRPMPRAPPSGSRCWPPCKAGAG